MTAPAWLIAGREFRAYAATASFWLALAMGPLLMGGALLLAGVGGRAPSTTAVLTLAAQPGGAVEARFSEGFPLSVEGRRRILGILEEDGHLGGPVRQAQPPKAPADRDAPARFALVMMLWMTLTGSLGMLLQAVVRERSSRALESLLAAARPWEIVLGKLAGVGAVSVLVLGAWLGGSAALAALAPDGGGLVAGLLRGLARPSMLARAAIIYLLAYGFYGLVTVAVGALARDNADAQNLARPLFAVLLAVFFVALACAGGGAQGLAWLVYVPPFTPFMLLMAPHPAGMEAAAVALLAAAAALAGAWAMSCLRIDRPRLSIRWMGTPGEKS